MNYEEENTLVLKSDKAEDINPVKIKERPHKADAAETVAVDGQKT